MPVKYEEWLQTFTFEKCGVGREEYGDFLMSYIQQEKDGLVLNLNGRWGSGKTEFLKRMYSGLHDREYPVIYIDAWESDFTDNPLIVVASEMLSQLKSFFEIDGRDLEILQRSLGKFLKAGAIAASGVAGKFLIGDSNIAMETVKALVDKTPEDYLESITSNYNDQIKAIKQIRKQLEELSSQLSEAHQKNLPVVVLVDELDRCRPNYAVEMLEVIKHFFATKNFVFVVATDTEELKKSIKVLYGNDFDSSTYLKRFFNREASLDEPNLVRYIESFEIHHNDALTLYPVVDEIKDRFVNRYLLYVARAYQLSLRDIEQLVAQLNACLRTLSISKDTMQLVNIFSLLVALVEFKREDENFFHRKYDQPVPHWQGVDFTVNDLSRSKAVKFSELYFINMNFSVDHKGDHSTDHNGNKTYVRLKAFNLSRLKLDANSSEFLKDIDNSLRENTSKEGVMEHRVLKWHDYQQLAKLANTLS